MGDKQRRDYGSGSISQRKDGTWTARIIVGTNEVGNDDMLFSLEKKRKMGGVHGQIPFAHQPIQHIPGGAFGKV